MLDLDIRKIAVEVRERITVWPETHDQGEWLSQPNKHGATYSIVVNLDRVDTVMSQPAAVWAECGTVACLAGHITAVAAAERPELLRYATLHSGPASWVDIQAAAASVMGMPVSKDLDFSVFSPLVSREDVLSWLDMVAAGESPMRAAEKVLDSRKTD